MDQLLPLKSESLPDFVQNFLRQEILNGKYHPGDVIVEQDICKLLQVSRASVRVALAELEADKLIVKEHRRGTVVASIDYQDAQDLYAYRAILESAAVFEFCKLATVEELNQLRTAIEELHRETELGDVKRILVVVANFYDIILTGCGNKLIKESLIKLRERITMLRLKSMSQPNRIFVSLKEMDQIGQLILARDCQGAKDAALHHIQEASKVALETIRSKSI
jgi:DNA-binding GntR family transcriptional regulator